jgi:hypothetical protein
VTTIIGRPSKKTPEIVDALLKVIATGAPYSICAASVGLHPDTIMVWKREDRKFASAVEKAAAKSALRLLEKIEKHGEESFPPLAWILERRFPQQFSRPEVQLNVQTNTQVNVGDQFVISVKGAEAVENRTRKLDCEVEHLFEDRERQKLSE